MSSGLLSTVRDLARRRARRRRHLTLAEGVRLVEEVLRAGAAIDGIVTAPMLQGSPRGRALKDRLAALPAPTVEVPDDELVRLADTEHPQGVIVVVSPPHHRLEDIVVEPGHPLLVLDGIQDPGNVGALCRTALGLGAAGMVALPGTADLFGPKALRGSAGALFTLPAVRSDVEPLAAWLNRSGVALYVAAADGRSLTRTDFGGTRVALAVGNEGGGSHLLPVDDSHRVAIPLAAAVESLNVAVAAGIILHEVTRGN